MSSYSSTYIDLAEKRSLFYQEWMPDKTPKAIILYVHGLGSHSSRLEHWAKKFVDIQVAFAAYDQWGHGKSYGKRGYPVHIKYMLEHLDIVIDYVRNQYSTIPLILYGHSMGGAEVINYSISHSDKIAGLIASSPWLMLTNPPSKFMIGLAKILSSVAPGLRAPNGLKSEDISTDPDIVKKYNEDPLIHNRIAFGLFNSICRNGERISKHLKEISCPFLLMHGTGDMITSAKANEEYIKSAGNNATLKLWDDAKHELHHEPIKDDIFNYIQSWLKSEKLI